MVRLGVRDLSARDRTNLSCGEADVFASFPPGVFTSAVRSSNARSSSVRAPFLTVAGLWWNAPYPFACSFFPWRSAAVRWDFGRRFVMFCRLIV
jgi:hypothetical protein